MARIQWDGGKAGQLVAIALPGHDMLTGKYADRPVSSITMLGEGGADG
jgi:hypothetical protein